MSALESFSDSPPSRHEEMLASIERTGYLPSVDRIPDIAPDALYEGNERVQRTADEPRRLVIVGPDAVSFDDQPAVELRRTHTTELLGMMLAVRALAPSAHYKRLGFFRDAGSDALRDDTFLQTTSKINAELTDSRGQPLITKTVDGAKLGIPDVEVTDMRRSTAYQTARYSYSVGILRRYAIEGGMIPAIYDNATVRAARSVIRELAGEADEHRLEILNQLCAPAIHSRIDELEMAVDLQFDEWTTETRHWLSDFFGGDPRAACKGPQRELFFPPGYSERKHERLDRERRAKAICAACIMKEECLQRGLALDKSEDVGIWGGTNEKDRREIRRNRS